MENFTVILKPGLGSYSLYFMIGTAGLDVPLLVSDKADVLEVTAENAKILAEYILSKFEP